jgi:hypothetical protein
MRVVSWSSSRTVDGEKVKTPPGVPAVVRYELKNAACGDRRRGNTIAWERGAIVPLPAGLGAVV